MRVDLCCFQWILATLLIPSALALGTANPSSKLNASIEEDLAVLEDIKLVNNVLAQYMSKYHKQTNILPTFTPDSFSNLPDLSILRQLFKLTGQTTKTHAMCHACKVGIGVFLLRARAYPVHESLMEATIFICELFKIASHRTCEGLVRRFGPILLYIVVKIPTITEKLFCSMVFQHKGCMFVSEHADWDIMEQMPEIFTNFPPVIHYELPNRLPVTKVIHLTDIHVDPFYAIGSETDCSEELCCRAEGGYPADLASQAGYFGDYRNCDLPYHSLENALKHISAQHSDAQVMYFTGDMVPHDVWNTSSEVALDIIRKCSLMIKEYFPNTVVIPVLGNHDTHPVNLFSPDHAPTKFSTKWVYTEIYKIWNSLSWMSPEAMSTFEYGGYYEMEISPQFKVIVLNTNLCYTLNFWLLYDYKDPANQLHWLARVLLKAEQSGQKVHILGHVAPGQSDCWDTWSRNFYYIISRFSSTVTAQFYGHTHFDEFKVFYHPKHRSTPISPIWLGASLTPYTDLNPGYKIYYVDNVRETPTFHVVDHETWIYNLTDANIHSERGPRWFKLYRATEAFGIPSVLPDELHNLIMRMSSSSKMFDTYFRFYHKAADPAMEKGCDTVCQKRALCDIVTPHNQRQAECILLQSSVDGVILPLSIFESNIPGRRDLPDQYDNYTMHGDYNYTLISAR